MTNKPVAQPIRMTQPPADFYRSEGGIYIMRHGQKHDKLDRGASNETRGAGGSYNDKTRIHITDEGATELMAQGRQLLDRREFGAVYVVVSDFVRTKETAECFLQANPTLAQRLFERRIPIQCDMNVGFGITPWNWKHPDMDKIHPFAYDQEGADANIKDWFEHFYFATPDVTRPVQAKMALGQVEAMLDILSYMKAHRNNGKQNLGLLVTHAPNADTWVNLVIPWVYPNRETGTVEISEARFPGHVPMGETYAVMVNGLATGNPDLEFHVKGAVKGMKRSELEERRLDLLKDTYLITQSLF